MYKICFITTISMTLNAFVKELAGYLHESGEFDIYFICDSDDEFGKALPEYVKYIAVPMKRGISVGGFKSVLQLKKIFEEYKFDIIQYSTPNASCYAAIAGFLAGIPVRLYCQWGLSYVRFNGIKRKIFKFIEKFVCKLSTWIEPDSYSNLAFCHDEGIYPNNKGSVIWNGSASGVNLNKFDISRKSEWCIEIRKKYNIPMDALVYIFIGRITGDKGINELFGATKKVMSYNENIYLLMVGSNEVSGNVDRGLYEWSLKEERIIYSGFTNEVEKYIAASDVYILPSYREGFGSSVIEAEAMGVPVIVTNIPGPINAMKKDVTGLVVEKANTDELTEAMQYLKDNPTEREKMGVQAYKFAKENFEQKVLFGKIMEDRVELINKGKKQNV